MDNVKVFIVDDHEIFRKGLKTMLKRIDFVDLAGEASDGKEFLGQLEKVDPELVLMDISMPGIDGIDATKLALEKKPGLKVIALTTFTDKDFFDNSIKAGADGYLLKTTSLDELKKAIETVMNGENYYSYEMLMKVTKNLVAGKKEAGKNEKIKLTDREKEVLENICKGLSMDKIAEKLFISARTVERHKYNLFEKTGTSNTVNLVIFAFKAKLVKLG